jgi:RND family efflux transporter MFP subunit
VLVRLHAPALDASVAQAAAGLGSAEKQEQAASAQERLATDTLTRYAQLRQRHSVTPFELDQIEAQAATAQAQQQGAEAQIAAARSSLAAQRANASDASIYAPFDGVVTKRMVDPGAMATPGAALIHIQSTGAFEVEFSAPEDLAHALKIGGKVSVALDGDTACSAVITNISPAGDAGSHSFMVKAILPNSITWNSGTVVQVLLPTDQKASRIVVPAHAIVQQGGLDAILIATPDGHAEVRYVTLWSSTATEARILSGLASGDRVLLQGDLGLAGRKIEVQP